MGRGLVVEKVIGYKKIKFHTHENAGYGDVRLPDMQMHTTSFWLTVPEHVFVEMGRATAIDALRGVGRALETVATIALMCEPRDIGQTVGDKSPESARESARHFDPTLFLFDHIPGGWGSPNVFSSWPQRSSHALARMIARCPCPTGCPGCVGPTDSGGGRKEACLQMLDRMHDTARSS